MKMLKTKHLRRLAVFLAMIAPAVYLFGSLFAGLTGAHGSQIFAESDDHSSSFVDVAYEKGYWMFSGGAIYPDAGGVVSDSVNVFYPYDGTYVFKVSNLSNLATLAVGFYNSGSFVSRITTQTSLGLGFTFTIPSDIDSFRLACNYNNGAVPSDFDMSLEVSYPSSDDDYFSSSAYSDYVFGQFFTKDNFLVDWGRDAVSENPHGFAPFGAFWRYLDTNVLHLSSQQIGLMGYGYVYYCCHVLLFDIAFILVTFFLDFIQKVNDKVVGGVD